MNNHPAETHRFSVKVASRHFACKALSKRVLLARIIVEQQPQQHLMRRERDGQQMADAGLRG